jgi:hypothetical protein
LAQKVAELENDKAQLSKKYAQDAKDSSSIGHDQKIFVNQCKKAYLNKICDAVKAKVWGVFSKFLSSHPEDCPNVVYTLARRGMDPKIQGTEQDEEKKWEFQHSTLIAHAMNKTQNYCQSELRKKMEGKVIAKCIPFPLTDQIAKCVYRTIDKDHDAEEMALFKAVYVEELLPPVLRRRKEFGTYTSHYQTILEAICSAKGVKLVTPKMRLCSLLFTTALPIFVRYSALQKRILKQRIKVQNPRRLSSTINNQSLVSRRLLLMTRTICASTRLNLSLSTAIAT